jgi:DNA polymerase-3 subunit delta'
VAFTTEVALDYLRRAQSRGRLGHAYLITGPAGSGKRALAAGVAELVNGAPAQQVFAGGSSEIHLTGPESKSRRISIDQLRELEHALQMRARDGRRKVAIISDADRMGKEAANAFLKTLEEPPYNSLLLLLSAIPEVLPETIRSRCIAMPLAAPTDPSISSEEEELIDLFNSFDPTAADGVHEAYRLVQGFQKLFAKMRRGIQEENDAALKREETRYRNTSDGADWLETREAYYKALTESRYLEQRGQLLQMLFVWWGDILRASSGVAKRELPAARAATEAVATRLTTAAILRRLRRLEELRDHLGRNIAEALALEVAFLNVFRL